MPSPTTPAPAPRRFSTWGKRARGSRDDSVHAGHRAVAITVAMGNPYSFPDPQSCALSLDYLIPLCEGIVWQEENDHVRKRTHSRLPIFVPKHPGRANLLAAYGMMG
jgi:hypothetical protein